MIDQVSATQAVQDSVLHVEFGPVTSFENLSVVPVLDERERDGEYITLDEALAGAGRRLLK